MNVFEYKSLNGILKHFYNKGKEFYSKNVEIFSSSNADSLRTADKAFDFDNSTHWTGNSKPENQTLGFCFEKKYKVFVSDYEIRASKEWLSPKIWAFSGSDDKLNWKYKEEHHYEMKKNEIRRVSWYHGPFRCFQLTSIKSISDKYSIFDVSQIEIFGAIALKDILTSKHKITLSFNVFVYLIILNFNK